MITFIVVVIVLGFILDVTINNGKGVAIVKELFTKK